MLSAPNNIEGPVAGLHPKRDAPPDLIQQVVDCEFEVQSPSTDNPNIRTIQGAAAIYDQFFLEYEDGDRQYRRMNADGMFKRSLSQNPKVILSKDHDYQALASTDSGTLLVWEADKKLQFKGEVDTRNSMSQNLVVEMERGVYKQASMRFSVSKQEIVDNDTGGQDRIIKEASLDYGDVGPVMYGMNPNAYSSVQCAKCAEVAQLPTPPRTL